jgi:glycosyltransferase involved in cell wall biosynthesis
MQKIIVYTYAYNAEKTIRRTIDSIIAQTYKNWIYYVVDNGSTDSTGAIIREYAERDARIIALANKENNVWLPGNFFYDIALLQDDNDFLCNIDADDEYKMEFLEKTLAYAVEGGFDIVAFGHDALDAATSEFLYTRKLNENRIYCDDNFGTDFPIYHYYMRTWWCKLNKIAVYKRIDVSSVTKYLSYGYDTLFTTELFKNAERVGILAESLHNYFISNNSESYKFDKQRVQDDRTLFSIAQEYLISKVGFVSEQNEEFLLMTYMEAIKSTIMVILNAKISMEEKLFNVLDVLTNKYTKQLAEKENFGSAVEQMSTLRAKLFVHVMVWLIDLEEIPDEFVEKYCDAGEFLSKTTNNTENWLVFKKMRVDFLINVDRIDEAKAEVEELLVSFPNDEEVRHLRRIWSR